MTFAQRLKKDPFTFRRLTGITPEKFDEVFQRLKPRYDTWNEKRLTRKNRKRPIGPGRRFTLPLEDRFLMLLLYYRTYVTHVFLGFLFHIDDSNVGRNINPLQPLLAGIFTIPEQRIDLSEEEILTLFFDGTEQQTQRPEHKQRTFYSGKKKRHTVKHMVVVARKRGKGKERLRIVAISKSFGGKAHDKKIYQAMRATAPPRVRRKGDLGFQGTILLIPIKKKKGRELTKRQKRLNRRFASARICIEHAIGKLKIWRMAAERYRNKRSMHTVMFKNIAGLTNLMFS